MLKIQTAQDELDIHNYYRSIVDTVRQPLLVLDGNLNVKTANKAFYRTFKVKVSQTEERMLSELGNGQWNIPTLLLKLTSILTKNTHFEDLEVNHEFPSIGQRVMMLNARRLSRRPNQYQLILLAIEDVTERKQSQVALELLNKQLERSNRELQDFASVASHDLQEPLRKIRAFGDLLVSHASDLLDAQDRDYINRMQTAASRMQRLINDLLTFSRVSNRPPQYEQVNLSEVVKEVVSDLEITIEQAGGELIINQLPAIEADKTQMQQLFQNLIANALKFHKKDEKPLVEITAKIKNGLLDKNCSIAIKDNGIGVEDQYKEQIFQIFQRLHSQGEYSGTGIGLAVCRKIVDRHNGSISVTSKPGNGTIFTINLPLIQQKGDHGE